MTMDAHSKKESIKYMKEQYNKLLHRRTKGVEYLDNIATEEEQNQWIHEFKNIQYQLSSILMNLEELECDVETIEILEGFKNI